MGNAAILDLFSPIAVFLDAFEGPLFIFEVEQDSVGEFSARWKQHKKLIKAELEVKDRKSHKPSN